MQTNNKQETRTLQTQNDHRNSQKELSENYIANLTCVSAMRMRVIRRKNGRMASKGGSARSLQRSCFRENYGGPLVYSALGRSALEWKVSDAERKSSVGNSAVTVRVS